MHAITITTMYKVDWIRRVVGGVGGKGDVLSVCAGDGRFIWVLLVCVCVRGGGVFGHLRGTGLVSTL